VTRFVSLPQMLIFQYILLIFYRCKFKYVAYIILHQKKKWKFFVLEFLLTSCNAHFHKFYFTFPCITLLIEHSPNSQRPAKAIFSLRLYKSILSDLQFQKTMSRLCFFSIDFISSSLYLPSLSIRLFLPFCFAFVCSKCFATSIASLTLFSPKTTTTRSISYATFNKVMLAYK